MAQVLEWFQCKACGRRHRWKAEIAGTEIECACGEGVLCPALDVASDPSDGSGTGVAPSAAAPADADALPDEVIALEGEEGAGEIRYQRKRGAGLFGMGRFGEMVFWMVGAAIGFALLVHAIVLQWPAYVVATVIWAPISFWMARRKLKRWQGNRSLVRAIEEEFDRD